MSLYQDVPIGSELITGRVGPTPSHTAMDVAMHIPLAKIASTSYNEPEALVTAPRPYWLTFWKGNEAPFRDSNRRNGVGIAIESHCDSGFQIGQVINIAANDNGDTQNTVP